MRYLIPICVLCCAGCASWRNGPTPTWSAAPMVQPNDAAPTPTTTPGSEHTTGRPVGPDPTDDSPSTTIRQRPQTQTPRPGAAPYLGSPTGPLMTPPTGRDPAEAEPTSSGYAPYIPNPNPSASAPTHVAGHTGPAPRDRSGSLATSPQRGQSTPSVETVSTTTGWRHVGRSSGGRPIEMMQIGRGERHLVLMGSLFGNERGSVEFVTALADLLHREPQRLGDYSIVCIRTPNPDGFTEATLTNSRGVELNRNFPSQKFFAQRTPETGLTPASEPETQAILHLCDDFRPDRVIHVRAGQATRPLVLANTKAVAELRGRLDRSLMDGGEFEAYKAGSVEEYATDQLQAELLLLWLPGDTAQWRKALPQMATVLLGPPASSIRATRQTPADIPPVTTTLSSGIKGDAPAQRGELPDLFAPYQPPAALAGSLEPAASSGLRGFVELLPPPPEFSEETQGRDSRFYALPPPPG